MLAALPPAAAANECVTSTTTGVVCHTFTLTSPAPQAGNLPAWGTYYLWVGPGKCVPNALAPECRGVPAGQGSTAGLVGLLYKETNGASGLQRGAINIGGTQYSADAMVLL